MLVVIVIDTSAIVAVLTSEPQRQLLVRATEGVELLAPGSVHWEVGNALSAFLKRRRATIGELQRCLAAYKTIPIRYLDVDLSVALEIAAEHDIYAYDAYLVAGALAKRAPLLTLDRGLKRAARNAGVQLVELQT